MNGKEAPWCKVPLHVLRDDDVTLGMLRVYGTLDYLSGKRGDWYGDVALLTEEAGVSQPTVSRALALLATKGYIHVRDLPAGSRYQYLFSVLARFTDESQLFTDELPPFTDEYGPSLLTTQTSPQTSPQTSIRPRKRNLGEKELLELEQEFPLHRVRDAAADYLNYGPNARHVDKVMGLRNMLNNPRQEYKFRKVQAAPGQPAPFWASLEERKAKYGVMG